jgi:hypothetical protein
MDSRRKFCGRKMRHCCWPALKIHVDDLEGADSLLNSSIPFGAQALYCDGNKIHVRRLRKSERN